MKDKRAFMKTVEAFLAIIIVFTFVVFFMPRDVRTSNDQSIFRLKYLELDDGFRQCVIERNDSCIETTINDVFEERYSFDYVLYEYVEPEVNIEEDAVKVYSWFFAGTREKFKPTHFKLLYWDKDVRIDSPFEDSDGDSAIEVTFSNLTAQPDEITVDESLEFFVDVENAGEDDGEYTVSFLVDDALVGTDTVFIEANSVTTASLEYSPDESGTYEVSVDELQTIFTVLD
ncbi:MAG: CARDB domain-containing protein [Candidatus Woesearchaeota archaeon]